MLFELLDDLNIIQEAIYVYWILQYCNNQYSNSYYYNIIHINWMKGTHRFFWKTSHSYIIFFKTPSLLLARNNGFIRYSNSTPNNKIFLVHCAGAFSVGHIYYINFKNGLKNKKGERRRRPQKIVFNFCSTGISGCCWRRKIKGSESRSSLLFFQLKRQRRRRKRSTIIIIKQIIYFFRKRIKEHKKLWTVSNLHIA